MTTPTNPEPGPALETLYAVWREAAKATQAARNMSDLYEEAVGALSSLFAELKDETEADAISAAIEQLSDPADRAYAALEAAERAQREAYRVWVQAKMHGGA